MKIQFDVPPSSAQESQGLPVRYATSRRQVPRWRWYLLLAIVLAAPAYLATRFAVSYWWETVPAVVRTEQVVVRAQAAGRVARIANVGDQIPAGQAVMELQSPATAGSASIAAPLAQTAGDPRRAQAETLAIRQTMLDEAQRLAQRQLALQQERLRTMESLRAQEASTRQEVDNARFQELQARTDAAKARTDASENRAQLAYERGMVRTVAPVDPQQTVATAAVLPVVAAPFDVTVVRQLVRQGERVEPDTEVAVLQGHAAPMVYAYLPPEESRYAQVGRQATLRFMDGGRVRAEVVGVVAEAERTPTERVSPLSPRMPSIVVRLSPLEALPPAYRIHQLPLDVRFDWVRNWF